ncbi:MAG: crossover junction endodeoxyribonuclease RuvC [Oscillospiraceae bacterium]|jgi:crossover junction endodeoxyribonuclease RuvC|nr:crossover junction endodeoxyribonuclease RuvC [Oscillospiraceae bacterium]
MTILGIDPGLATMGWGVIETDGSHHSMRGYGALLTRPGQTMPARLVQLFDGVAELLRIYEPGAVAFEELFFSKNVTTAMAVGAARGAAMLAAARHTGELYEYTPMQVKQAITGYGKADKQQMQWMVRVLLNLDEIPKPDDAADALAVAIAHAHAGRSAEEFRIK